MQMSLLGDLERPLHEAVKVKPILQWRSEIQEVCQGKLQSLGGNGPREELQWLRATELEGQG